MNNDKKVYSFFKRMFDIIFSLFLITILSWLFIALAAMVKFTSKGPIFYRHKRVGKDDKIIKIIKFRSMHHHSMPLDKLLTKEQLKEYHKNYKIKNDPRITKVGKFLRRTSLDELPQLFNVFFGDLSFVGPRPVLYEETILYGENRNMFLSIRPGMTGYFVVNRRSQTTYEKRIEMELFYVINRSVNLDFKILLQTLVIVMFQQNENWG